MARIAEGMGEGDLIGDTEAQWTNVSLQQLAAVLGTIVI
jgi:hypothetical protein